MEKKKEKKKEKEKRYKLVIYTHLIKSRSFWRLRKASILRQHHRILHSNQHRLNGHTSIPICQGRQITSDHSVGRVNGTHVHATHKSNSGRSIRVVGSTSHSQFEETTVELSLRVERAKHTHTHTHTST